MRKKQSTKITLDNNKGKLKLNKRTDDSKNNIKILDQEKGSKNEKNNNRGFLHTKRKKPCRNEEKNIKAFEVIENVKANKNTSFNFLLFHEFNQILFENEDLKIFKDPNKIKKIKFDVFLFINIGF